MPAAGGYWPLCTHHFGPPWLSCNHVSLPRLEGETNGEGRPSTRSSHNHPTLLTQSFQFPPEYSRPEILLALRQKPRGDWLAAPSMAGPLRKERKGIGQGEESQVCGAHLHRCPRHTTGVLRRGPRPLGGAGGAGPAQGPGRPGSPQRCMAPGFGRWGRPLPGPEGKQEHSAPSSISCLLPASGPSALIPATAWAEARGI